MIKIEVTDTFGGEANYSWVKHYEIKDKNLTNRQIVLRAKALAEWTGLKCITESFGDMIKLRPIGCHWVMFITFE